MVAIPIVARRSVPESETPLIATSSIQPFSAPRAARSQPRRELPPPTTRPFRIPDFARPAAEASAHPVSATQVASLVFQAPPSDLAPAATTEDTEPAAPIRRRPVTAPTRHNQRRRRPTR
ncbi:hypothetical protein ND748_19385 [Frankia sp. AiPs1]|nr:hypothetical protein [Frankia sp. AiPs1]